MVASIDRKSLDAVNNKVTAGQEFFGIIFVDKTIPGLEADFRVNLFNESGHCIGFAVSDAGRKRSILPVEITDFEIIVISYIKSANTHPGHRYKMDASNTAKAGNANRCAVKFLLFLLGQKPQVSYKCVFVIKHK
jgi:hypothetical protein